MNENEILKLLDNTELSEQLKDIRAFYDRLEKKQEVFCEKFCIHCKKGCGSCCEHFTPDISLREAEYLAFGLVSEGKDEEVLKNLENWDSENPTCPLYNVNDPDHHCTVYKWRPLICRLFGASASKNKEGRPCYRHCKFNEEACDVSANVLEKDIADVVTMSDYGLELEGKNAEDDKTLLLPVALKHGVGKVRLMLRLEAESQDK